LRDIDLVSDVGPQTSDFRTHRFKADRGDAGQRIDLVLRRRLADVAGATRTRLQSWIAGGRVSINAVPVERSSARLAVGDDVAVLVHAPPRLVAVPESGALSVLFEDEHLLAVDKPAGVVAHPTYRHASGTLLNSLLGRAREWRPAERPSLVNRLDKLTSGVVLVAKTAGVHAALQQTLASPRSSKEYLAVVYGRVRAARGRIAVALGRGSDRRRVIAMPEAGSASVTEFERLGRVAAPDVGLALLKCRLLTGRRHQIRVHLAARGWPIVGDPEYGQPLAARVMDRELAGRLAAFQRQALHAWRVALVHPMTREPLSIEAPCPDDLAALLSVTGLSGGLSR
jgi:23S rRNA pseudouridine1911/1915/1917 synthase